MWQFRVLLWDFVILWDWLRLCRSAANGSGLFVEMSVFPEAPATLSVFPKFVMSMSVCVSVCPRAYIRNHTRDLYQVFVRVAYVRGSVFPGTLTIGRIAYHPEGVTGMHSVGKCNLRLLCFLFLIFGPCGRLMNLTSAKFPAVS